MDASCSRSPVGLGPALLEEPPPMLTCAPGNQHWSKLVGNSNCPMAKSGLVQVPSGFWTPSLPFNFQTEGENGARFSSSASAWYACRISTGQTHQQIFDKVIGIWWKKHTWMKVGIIALINTWMCLVILPKMSKIRYPKTSNCIPHSNNINVNLVRQTVCVLHPSICLKELFPWFASAKLFVFLRIKCRRVQVCGVSFEKSRHGRRFQDTNIANQSRNGSDSISTS